MNFSKRLSAVKKKKGKNILPLDTEYHPSVPNLKTILVSNWHLIENQPLLEEIYMHSVQHGHSPAFVQKRETFERLRAKL